MLAVVSACAAITGVDENSSAANGRIDDLVISDITVGSGAEAVDGKRVQVHYTGWLYDPGAGNKREYSDSTRA